MHRDITGIILAGGHSARMGVNKSLLPFGDRTVIEKTLDLINSLFAQTLLSVQSSDELAFLHVPMVEDIYRNAGPLAGIHACLSQSTTERNFVIPCDLPLMSAEMIEYLVNYETTKPIVIARAAGRLQPQIGIYGRCILPVLVKVLKAAAAGIRPPQSASLHALTDLVDVEILNPGPLPFYCDELFFNMNSPEEYTAIKRRMSENARYNSD